MTTACNGADAVALAGGRPDLDLILMDIQMPVMDGLEAARRMLAHAGERAPRLLALTAGNTVSERQRAREAGFSEILPKPIDPEKLVQAIQRVLALALAPAPAPAAATPASGPAQDDWPVIDGIDTAQARRRFAGGSAMFGKMLARLLALCGEAGRMGMRVPRDRDALAALMHQVKGSAATLAALGLAESAARIESACRNGQDDALPPALQDLGRLARRLEQAAAGFLARPEARRPPETAAPLGRAQLEALLQALRTQDLRALDLFQQLAPALEDAMGTEAARALAEQVHGLRFGEALASLLHARLSCDART
ncbi:response regulator [Massilia yuzhufengensis]|uniref:Response regulatory domain-containing protein n=1 Tax=Massilia yuzhufengensis TaxID=1164594 RepID=A0A1I1PXA0_9BURK|nr:response regulator [Massilia yuzhufengensis]SFD14524.1 hypothetical protein SAMN05216204_11760 [Massilia yuzhufengensis]